jgi:hypothetical protein
MSSPIVESIRKRFNDKAHVEAYTTESMNWFRKFVGSKYFQIPGLKILRDYKKTTNIKLGHIYSYGYDPKWKDSLDYYDTFPLVLVIGLYDDGWLGINLHYVPVKYRYLIFEGLLKTLHDQTINERTRFKITYDKLNALKISKWTGNTIKRYLFDYVPTNIYKIPPEDWEIIMALPYDDFVGAPRRQVYREMLQ